MELKVSLDMMKLSNHQYQQTILNNEKQLLELKKKLESNDYDKDKIITGLN